MGPGWLQILLVVLLLILLFGRGKISGLMGDVAQGIKSFKKGMAEEEKPEEEEKPKSLDKKSETTVDEKTAEKTE